MSATRNQYVVTAYIKDKRGKILSVGHNSYTKTHPQMLKLAEKVGYRNQEKINIHAEVDAINKCVALNRAHVMEVFVYSARSNSYRVSKPCVVCKLALSKFNIPYVRFINNKGKQVTIKTEDLK